MKIRKDASLRRLKALLLALLLGISWMVVAAVPASASTVYDGVVSYTSSLEIKGSSFCTGGQDHTSDWASAFITGASSGYYGGAAMTQAQAATSFNNRVNWGVSQQYTGSNESILIWWADDSSVSLGFHMDGPFPSAAVTRTGSGGIFASIAVQVSGSGCNTYIYGSNYTTGSVYYSQAYDSADAASLGFTMKMFYEPAAITTYPSGYAGLKIPDQYTALGDSYSSGQGSGNYDLGGGGCLRSSDSYPNVLASPSHIAIQAPDLTACSGAITDDIFNANTVNTNEVAQLSHLHSDTQIVTITIGGDDVGFKDVLNSCLRDTGADGWGCSTDSSIVNGVNDRISELAGVAVSPSVYASGTTRPIHTYKSVIAAIASASPDAQIYIGGYPHLFGASSDDYSNNALQLQCIVGFMDGDISVSYDDAQWLNDKADDINTAISDAVDAERDLGVDVTYVAPTGFASHARCDSSTAYINGVSATWSVSTGVVVAPESFHPTVTGMSTYATDFETAVQNHS